MASPPVRRKVHTRSIRIDAYARDDGLWDIEAVLSDTKSKDFNLATGVRRAGDPVHEMTLRVTIDAHLNVLAAHAQSHWVPYPGYCDTIGGDYAKLVGLNLGREFRRHVRERLGGTSGCTHITELAAVLPSAAIQAFAGEVYQPRDTAHEPQPSDHEAVDRKPFQLDRCHALRTEGAAVARYYPRWYRSAAPGNEGSSDIDTTSEKT